MLEVFINNMTDIVLYHVLPLVVVYGGWLWLSFSPSSTRGRDYLHEASVKTPSGATAQDPAAHTGDRSAAGGVFSDVSMGPRAN